MNLKLIRLSELTFWKKSALSLFAGILLAATLAPLHIIFLLPVCLSLLLILTAETRNKKQSFFIGWWFGFGYFTAGLYWIGVAFTIDAGAHAALIPIPTLVLPACLAIFTGLSTFILYVLQAKGIARIFIFAASWTMLEYIRGILFTGFPWNLIGYAWGDILPMLQWTAYVGIYGLTLVTVFVCSVPALLTETSLSVRKKNYFMLADSLLILALVTIGTLRLNSPPLENIENSEIRIVQPNNDQETKWKTETRFSHVQNLEKLSRSEAGEFRYLIWPETAVPFFITTDERISGYLQRLAPKEGALITGAPRRDPVERKYWNSVQALSSTGEIIGVYDKRHLLPYGEYLPLRSFLESSGVSSLIPALDNMSDFSFPPPGANDVMKLAGLPPFRTLICYEVTFPWEVKSDDEFDWILNVTNDAWFGHTSGPYQHFVISRTRAIEQGVSLIRSANKGISAVVDGYGRILDEIPPTKAGIIDTSIPKALENRTLYGRIGEILPLVTCVIFLTIGLTIRRFH
ncbi:apolipoprotein N-acyltransferase [Sneathiella glossodoripedis]|uniref:apolipoprotein N-acyltransferase n=1 Tax=Sneathiella glossodoripedis TaxID=418853 RepID=UPI0004710B05|nr:apolipoprotein N-acyltransferase [Sneathiella glossodoripedis]